MRNPLRLRPLQRPSRFATRGWRVESVADDGIGCVFSRAGLVRLKRQREGSDNGPCVCEGSELYLLRTQAPDGSWHVKSRSIWVQPYFDSGFPYEHDQWISAAGTSWAAMALAVSAEPQRISKNLP